MNRATVAMVVIALASAAGAWSMRPRELPELPDLETGQALFENFTDPTVAASLEVTSYDKESASVVRFAVEQKEGRWVIPSHNDYPADGTERMGKAAASFIGVKKDKQYGDRPEDHAAFGVLDPEASEGKPEEKGQRIKIADASGTVLVDIIVGKEVPQQQGMYYVRYPDGKRVYGARLQLDISTTFSDWIEKDLLKVDREEIVTVSYDPYSVDEQQGKVVGSDPIVAMRDLTDDSPAGKWVAAEGTVVPPGKELDEAKIRQISTAIANIKIVGVRPRPERLTLMDLQSKGFFVATGGPQPRLFGNEGQASIATKDGLLYTLYFGEITYETGIALTAGVKGEGESSEAEAEAEGEGAEEGEDTTKTASRFMWVDINYDPTLDTTLAENNLSPTPEGPDAEGAEGESATGAEDAAEDEQKKVQGAQRADKLRQRFDGWYYVISDSSFKQIHKDRAELFKDAKTGDE
jgi:hypothetical protein